MIEALGAALLMGLLSSVHCALMCGPLALAGCGRQSETAGYFAGRAISYAFGGAIFGFVGHAMPLGSWWAFLLGALMIAHGIALLLRGAIADRAELPRSSYSPEFRTTEAPRTRRLAGISLSELLLRVLRVSVVNPIEHSSSASRLVQLPRRRAPIVRFLMSLLPRRGLALGLATGALPCGMLAGAWMVAASTAHPVQGALVMLAFSAASLPGLIVPLLARRIAARAFSLPPAIHGALWCLLGLFVAARPFFSGMESCH